MKEFDLIYKSILRPLLVEQNKEGWRLYTTVFGGGKRNRPAEMTEKEVLQMILAIKFIIEQRNPYLAGLLKSVPIIIVPPDHDIQTMAVDMNNNLYINPNFTKDLLSGAEEPAFDKNYPYEADDPYNQPAVTQGEKLFLGIIAHELLHIFKYHMARMGDKTVRMSNGATLWNLVTDMEINDELIYNWGYHIIKSGIITEPDGTYSFKIRDKQGNPQDVTIKVRGRTPERLYNEIINMLPPAEPGEGGESEPSDGSPVPILPGDIVFDPNTGKYGEVVTINMDGTAKIGELTEQEAKSRVK